MEFAFPSFPILLSFLVFVFMVLKIWKRSKTSGTNLPPGPWKLPLIGNLHQLVGFLPHHRLRDLAMKYGPFMHLHIGEVSTIVVSSPDFAKEVMKYNDVTFASRPYHLVNMIMTYNYSDIALSPYGEHWRQVRKIATLEVFSTKRVQSFRSIREEEVSNLINWIASSKAGSPINLTKEIHSLTNVITARAAFGKKCKDGEKFLAVLKETNDLSGGFTLADLFPSIEWLLELITRIKSKIEKLHQELDQILENILNEHKKGKSEGNEDVVDVLLKVQADGDDGFHLATDSIKAVIWDVFAAGTEMSSSTLEWALAEMLKHPRVLEKAQAEVRKVFDRKGYVDEADLHELEYLKLVTKETFRLHPVLPFLLPRECRESCQIDGYDIPVGSQVIVNAWAIGRDPNNWTNPESFYPERFLGSSIDYKGSHFELIPFGSGKRICPGITFAMANIELPLANFLYHFDWKLPNGVKNEDLDMAESFGLTARRKGDLHLIPIPYHPPPLSK
ncbi:hypothetical protein ACOSP7_030146 [Xanthoceras sorbifolium]